MRQPTTPKSRSLEHWLTDAGDYRAQCGRQRAYHRRHLCALKQVEPDLMKRGYDALLSDAAMNAARANHVAFRLDAAALAQYRQYGVDAQANIMNYQCRPRSLSSAAASSASCTRIRTIPRELRRMRSSTLRARPPQGNSH
jgi:hypothetical protein